MELSNGILASVGIIRHSPSEYSFVKVDQDLSTTVFRMTGPEMEAFAAILTAEAARLRKLEDDRLNAEIAELDVKYPKVA